MRSQPPGDSRLVRDALAAALRAPAADGTTRLDAVLAALLDKAAGGDLAAIKEVFDRAEGRPGPTASEPDLPQRVVFGWKRDGYE